MLTLPFVETMITQVCNLSCRGCTNYSDLRHSGYVSWDQGRQWLEQWQARLDFSDIGIMGGEPLINPEWKDWLFGVRRMFPHSQIRFTTNGLLLSRHPDLMSILEQIGNIVFKITVHVNSVDLEHWIQDWLDRYPWQPVQEFGINRLHLSDHGIRFQINRPQHFVSPFRNDYQHMRPWQSDPEAAFARCVQQTCPLLYQGRIYKCSTSALLRDTLERFGNPNPHEWMPYIAHGISPQSDQQELENFVSRFGRPESICGQCPDHTAPLIDHRLAVTVKNQ